MIIALRADVSVLEGTVKNAPRRISFAVVNAINEVTKLAQRALVLHAGDIFKLRKREFVERQVAIIKPFASVGKSIPYAEISVGQKPRLLLPLFERGGAREPFKGKSVAIPVGAARPTPTSSVPESLFIQRLGLQKLGTAKFLRKQRAGGRKPIWVGRLGTYLVPGVGIFQRLGHAAARAIYVFVRRVRVRPVLQFVSIVRGVADRNFARLLTIEVQKAIDYARGKR